MPRQSGIEAPGALDHMITKGVKLIIRYTSLIFLLIFLLKLNFLSVNRTVNAASFSAEAFGAACGYSAGFFRLTWVMTSRNPM